MKSGLPGAEGLWDDTTMRLSIRSTLSERLWGGGLTLRVDETGVFVDDREVGVRGFIHVGRKTLTVDEGGTVREYDHPHWPPETCAAVQAFLDEALARRRDSAGPTYMLDLERGAHEERLVIAPERNASLRGTGVPHELVSHPTGLRLDGREVGPQTVFKVERVILVVEDPRGQVVIRHGLSRSIERQQLQGWLDQGVARVRSRHATGNLEVPSDLIDLTRDPLG